MKIGLMTWYKGENYGTILQSYSLFSILNKKYDVEFINYVNRGNFDIDFDISRKEMIELFNSKIKNKMKNKLYFSDEKTKLFEDFSKRIVESKKCISFYDLIQLEKNYDKVICGSDQIWNPNCFDENYFLNFCDSSKIISYAPSFGVDRISNTFISSRMKKLIGRFNILSVREETGKKIIYDLTGKEANVVLDPTLLTDANDWYKICNSRISKNLPKKYMICYFLNNNKNFLKQAISVAKRMNIEIFVIPIFKSKDVDKYRVPFEVGPCEFLSLIRNSECVFTDSYHGMLFSIIFNKNFYVFKRFKKNSLINQNTRIYNTLNKFNLKDRLVCKSIKYENIDYNEINKILLSERKKSLDYLYNSIKTKNNNFVKDINNINSNVDCCGCGACVNVCPVNAIKLKKDKYGFEKAIIDNNKCIKCGLCKRVCPLYNYSDSKNIENELSLYSFKSNDSDILEKSSSGGFSFELMKKLYKSYYIAGCVYNYEKNIAEHILIKPNEFDSLKLTVGSKYIKSSTIDVFKEILNLPDNSKVLFTGTPCQCASLKNLVKIKNKKIDVLYVDLVCHGITTPLLWEKYLREFNNGNRLSHLSFRDKKKGSWQKKYISLIDKDKSYGSFEIYDNYLNLFLNGKCYMGSCYECPFRNKSCADLRIGDYWGNKFINDKTGVSMIVSFSNKGLNVLKSVKNGSISKNNISDYVYGQGINNPIRNIDREEVLEKIRNNVPLKQIVNDHLGFKLRIDKIRNIQSRIKNNFFKK